MEQNELLIQKYMYSYTYIQRCYNGNTFMLSTSDSLLLIISLPIDASFLFFLRFILPTLLCLNNSRFVGCIRLVSAIDSVDFVLTA